jgi:micrococcal nuclease
VSAPGRVAAGASILVLAAAGILYFRTPPPPPAQPAQPAAAYPAPATQFPVLSVYDGDTLRVRAADGESVPVRVLGIDTPELAPPPGTPATPGSTAPEDLGRYPECGAVQARDLARSLLLGRSVVLQSDPAQPSPDRFGRTLAYVSLPDGGQDLAASLLAAGWAQVFEQYPVSRTPGYRSLQAAAQLSETGGWAMCGWLQ